MLLYDRPRYSMPALIGGGVLFMTFLTLLVTFTDSDAELARARAAKARPANSAAIIARTPEAIAAAQRDLLTRPKAAQAASSASNGATVVAVASEAPASAAPPTEPPPPYSDYAGEMERNMTLSSMLARHGVGHVQINAIVTALRPHFSFRRARPGSKYSLTVRNADARVERFRFEHGPLEIYEARRDEAGVLRGHKLAVNVRTEVAAIGAKVKSTLYGAVQHTGESTSLAATLMDVFAYDIDFIKDTRPGDSFKLLVEKVFKDDQFIRYGKVLAAEYKSVKKGEHRAYWFTLDKNDSGSYYLEDGRNTRKTFLATPVRAARISSGFGMRRHPVLGYNRRHLGVDFAAPTGTPVLAMADGKVSFAGWKGANGKLIVLRHKNGLVSLYAHLSSIRVKRGQTVRQKQRIGAVGTTGRSTGPHLHFGVKKNGRYINPQKMKMTRDDGVPRKARGRFKALIKTRRAQLDEIGFGIPPVVAVAPERVVVPLPTPAPSNPLPPPAPVSDGIPLAQPVSEAAPASAAPGNAP